MEKEDIKIACEDSFDLSGALYIPKSIKGTVMIAPATGIRKGFYDSFARYLAENGYTTVCFENRGIGDSVKGSINAIGASLVNWGRRDMTAVLKYLKHNFPKQSCHLIGHSAGGQLVGLMPNACELNSIFNVACSSGSLQNMPFPFRLSANIYMNIFVPLSNIFFGKTNSQWVGMGDPLPKEVASQWRKWCNGKGYVEVDFGKAIKTHYYDKLDCASLWLYATDDPIANYENVKDMMRIFTKSKKTTLRVLPSELGIERIGHMGFFSRKNKVLWQYALDWLEKQS